jgi:RNA polymerase sigma-54 factor
MQEVADALGIHESTVSRAIANKYLQTPHGLYDLKYFFSAGVRSSGGDSVSVRNIKAMLRRICAQEDPRHPLSDQQIIEKLKEGGIPLARRTITKYRKELRIPSSSMRRRL